MCHSTLLPLLLRTQQYLYPFIQVLDPSLSWLQQWSSQAEHLLPNPPTTLIWRRLLEGFLRYESGTDQCLRTAVGNLLRTSIEMPELCLDTTCRATPHRGGGKQADTLMICTFCVQLNGQFGASRPMPRQWTVVLFINLSSSCYASCQWSPVWWQWVAFQDRGHLPSAHSVTAP